MQMDYQHLIEEITRLVMMELRKFPAEALHKSGALTEVVVLIDPEFDDLSGLVDILQKKTEQARYKIVMCERHLEPLKKVAGTVKFTPVVEPPRQRFAEVLWSAEQVIIPYLSVTTVSKIARLIGDEPVPGIAIKALLDGVPVVACADSIHGLKFSDCARPKKILGMIQDNMTLLEDMGVELVQLEKLPDRIGERKPEDPDSTIGIRNVITNEDVRIAANQKLKTLNFPKGTIVTPLARDNARKLGIEINLV
jgi:hypothetical protein